MTGTATNTDNLNILPGMALAEDSAGNVTVAVTEAFALATDAAMPGQIVNWSDEGTVTRSDWTPITGTQALTVGAAYYVGAQGKLAMSGTQRVGVARSSTVLRVSISAPVQKTSTLHPVVGAPPASLGAIGDFAFDSRASAFHGPKTEQGWGAPAYMVRSQSPAPLFYNPITSS